MKAWDIAAYTYAADTYCPGDMREIAAFTLAGPGEAAFMGRSTDGEDAEGFLNRWAAAAGIDRQDERSYDSDEFPKVVFASSLEDGETCGKCGGEL